jgi:predicted amidohydrolase
MYTTITVTAISLKPKKWDKDYNAEKLESYFRTAAREQADLIVAPEGILEGYVAMDVIRNPERGPAMLEIAEPIDGPFIRRFQRLAQELRTCLCFGFAERISDEVYNTAIFIDQDGDICGHYHKTQLAEGAHSFWYFDRIGRRIRAFDTPLGRMGMLICNDRANPKIARTLVLDGARCLLIPSYGTRKRSQNAIVTARARENGVPVVQANVGNNLIISKGEVVAYKWGCDQITTAAVELPALSSEAAARAAEREYMVEQPANMAERYRNTMQRVQVGHWNGRPGHTLSAAETRAYGHWERQALSATEHTK